MSKIGLLWSSASYVFLGVGSFEEMQAGAAGRGGGDEEKSRGRASSSSTTSELICELEVPGVSMAKESRLSGTRAEGS